MVYVWFLVILVLGIIELTTANLVSIWFVISGIISLGVSLFTDNITVQVSIFVILGIMLMPISKKIYKKINKNKVSTNLDRIIGMKGIVTEDITKDNIGEVKVDGKLWSAYADNIILKGERVKILSINSVKIKVERWKEK